MPQVLELTGPLPGLPEGSSKKMIISTDDDKKQITINLSVDEYATIKWALDVNPLALSMLVGDFINSRTAQKKVLDMEALNSTYNAAPQTVKDQVEILLGRKKVDPFTGKVIPV